MARNQGGATVQEVTTVGPGSFQQQKLQERTLFPKSDKSSQLILDGTIPTTLFLLGRVLCTFWDGLMGWWVHSLGDMGRRNGLRNCHSADQEGNSDCAVKKKRGLKINILKKKYFLEFSFLL